MVQSECVIKIVPGDRFTPFSLARMLSARVILESSSFQKGRERYSVLMIREAFSLIQDGSSIIFQPHGAGKRFRVESRARDILDVCRYFADQHGPVRQDFPFPAGGVGFLSYEFSQYCDTIKFSKQEDSLGMPDAAFLFGHVFVVFDHYTDKLILIGLNYREAQIDLAAELAALEARIQSWRDPGEERMIGAGELQVAQIVPELSDSDEEYMARVEGVRKEVIAGNLLQGVASRRLVLESMLEPLEAYRRLRSNNPSPYLFYLDFGDYQLIGASPEVHTKVRNGKAILRPIAGTRRRGATQEEDLGLEADLLADPKERAEHLMLVDLGRNDLGRVSKPGSVKVTEYMVIERYSHVMHIVSQVEGQLAEGKTGLDVFRATFPAGTVSGAPKIRAIEVLSRLEKYQRRHYAGAMGYMEPGGNLDTCIGIRTALKLGDYLVFQAGAGVVYDSTPERELEETREKLGGVAQAFGVKIGTWSSMSQHAAAEDVEVSLGYADSSSATAVVRPGSGPSAVSRARETVVALDPDRDIEAELEEIVSDQNLDHAGEVFGFLSELDGSDPWAEADAEAERLSMGNRSDPHPLDVVDAEPADEDPWAADDAEAEALAAAASGADQEEIIPLDWDFDPSSATGAAEIQDEIDNLINLDADQDAKGGQG